MEYFCTLVIETLSIQDIPSKMCFFKGMLLWENSKLPAEEDMRTSSDKKYVKQISFAV
jgi:hypothetical protein